VAGVVTQPDRPAGRGHKLVATPVKRAAEALGLRVEAPAALKPFAGEARSLGADAFVVASYGKIIPQMLLDVVDIAFNVHPSLLPLYRGATPLQSAIRDGRAQTGVSIIAMDAGMDTGDVLLQEVAEIGADETYGELHDRLAVRGAAMTVAALEQYALGALQRTPQREIARELGISDDEIARTLTRPLAKGDLAIDWTQPARRIVNHVRSLAPQPLARAEYGAGETLKIVAARALTLAEFGREMRPVLSYGSGSGLQAGGSPGRYRLFRVSAEHDDVVVVEKLIAPNRGPMSGEAYAQSVIERMRARVGWELE
jgi:methionyl-tRNA formyltransferase